jgi:hypothetical protein
MMLASRNQTGALLMKIAPVGTPFFDVDAPAVGMLGKCTTCHITAAELAHPLNLSGEGAAAQSMLRGYHNTSTP